MRIILSIVLLTSFLTQAFGDTVERENEIKAAFIFHFISYTQWKDTQQNYYLCIPDDKSLRETALGIFKDKFINNHKVIVSPQSEGCDVLVSDTVPSTDTTMTIGLLSNGALFEFRLIDNKMKFAVDLEKLKIFKFKISSQLLKLAIVENSLS